MQHSQKFDASKVLIIDYKIIKGQVDSPSEFDIENIKGHRLTNNLQMSFNLNDKLIKADFTVDIITDSNETVEEEAKANFHFVYVFKIENLEDLSKQENEIVHLDPFLANAVASITYSTSRGILLTRLQGTALQKFILPVIDANKLLPSN